MATSTSDLIDEVVSSLKAFTADTEAVGTLTNSIGPTDTTLQYDTSIVPPPSPGILEIDDELLRAVTIDETAGTLTVPAWGRGQQQSVAASHAAGSKITVSPTWPRARVLSVLNEVVRSLDSYLYAVRTKDITPSAAVSAYDLNADVVEILDVSQQVTGPSQVWRPIKRYKLDGNADTTAFPSGKSLTVGSVLEPGRTVKVTYAASLAPLVSGGLLTDTGLGESCRDILAMGAQYRLVMTADFARLINTTVEQAQSGDTPITSASSIAGRLKQNFDLRVADEKLRLQRLYPTRITYSR